MVDPKIQLEQSTRCPFGTNHLLERQPLTSAVSSSPEPADRPSNEGLIEIGVVVAGEIDPVDSRGLQIGAEQFREWLEEHFAEFQFRLPTIRRPELMSQGRAEPSVLLQRASEQRDARHWDFCFLVTDAELIGTYSPFCSAVVSRPLDAAVFTLSLLDPQAADERLDEQVRGEQIGRRLGQLMLMGMAHLLGLPRDERPDSLASESSSGEPASEVAVFSAQQLDRQRAALAEIADERLEEGRGRRMGLPAFAAWAAWINRREVLQAVVAARPWQFPRRLSRLTIAAVSTVTILLMTAEAWDLGLSQDLLHRTGLVVFSLLATTSYVIRQQQLLVRRGRRHTEQTIVTTVSAIGIVLTGMSVTWMTLWAMAAVASLVLFDNALIVAWAASTDLSVTDALILERLRMSAFAASAGLLIGSLGASFESQNYFRHIIFVDEEI